MVLQEMIEIDTPGRGTTEITRQVEGIVRQAGISRGICNIFIQHTSASLLLCENADPAVRADLETFMGCRVPDGDPMFTHTTEGPDDMAAHVRTVLTDTSITVPLVDGHCGLGTWQGIYLWEHRRHPHRRRIVVTLYGE